jgi:hypothetical protein
MPYRSGRVGVASGLERGFQGIGSTLMAISQDQDRQRREDEAREFREAQFGFQKDQAAEASEHRDRVFDFSREQFDATQDWRTQQENTRRGERAQELGMQGFNVRGVPRPELGLAGTAPERHQAGTIEPPPSMGQAVEAAALPRGHASRMDQYVVGEWDPERDVGLQRGARQSAQQLEAQKELATHREQLYQGRPTATSSGGISRAQAENAALQVLASHRDEEAVQSKMQELRAQGVSGPEARERAEQQAAFDWDGAIGSLEARFPGMPEVQSAVRDAILTRRNQAGAAHLGFSGPFAEPSQREIPFMPGYTMGPDGTPVPLQGGIRRPSPGYGGDPSLGPTAAQDPFGIDTLSGGAPDDQLQAAQDEWDQLVEDFGEERTIREIGPRPGADPRPSPAATVRMSRRDDDPFARYRQQFGGFGPDEDDDPFARYRQRFGSPDPLPPGGPSTMPDTVEVIPPHERRGRREPDPHWPDDTFPPRFVPSDTGPVTDREHEPGLGSRLIQAAATHIPGAWEHRGDIGRQTGAALARGGAGIAETVGGTLEWVGERSGMVGGPLTGPALRGTGRFLQEQVAPFARESAEMYGAPDTGYGVAAGLITGLATEMLPYFWGGAYAMARAPQGASTGARLARLAIGEAAVGVPYDVATGFFRTPEETSAVGIAEMLGDDEIRAKAVELVPGLTEERAEWIRNHAEEASKTPLGRATFEVVLGLSASLPIGTALEFGPATARGARNLVTTPRHVSQAVDAGLTEGLQATARDMTPHPSTEWTPSMHTRMRDAARELGDDPDLGPGLTFDAETGEVWPGLRGSQFEDDLTSGVTPGAGARDYRHGEPAPPRSEDMPESLDDALRRFAGEEWDPHGDPRGPTRPADPFEEEIARSTQEFNRIRAMERGGLPAQAEPLRPRPEGAPPGEGPMGWGEAFGRALETPDRPQESFPPARPEASPLDRPPDPQPGLRGAEEDPPDFATGARVSERVQSMSDDDLVDTWRRYNRGALESDVRVESDPRPQRVFHTPWGAGVVATPGGRHARGRQTQAQGRIQEVEAELARRGIEPPDRVYEDVGMGDVYLDNRELVGRGGENLRNMTDDELRAAIRETMTEVNERGGRSNPATMERAQILHDEVGRRGSTGLLDEFGAADRATLAAIGRTGAGALAGAALDDEDPLRGATLGGAAAGAAPRLLRGARQLDELGAVGAREGGPQRVDTGRRFYSRLQNAVQEGPGKAPADQWSNYLQPAKRGFPEMEREWAALDDFFRQHQGETLTRDQVLRHVQEQGVALDEVRYGRGGGRYHDIREADAAEVQARLAQNPTMQGVRALRDNSLEQIRSALEPHGWKADAHIDSGGNLYATLAYGDEMPVRAAFRALEEELGPDAFSGGPLRIADREARTMAQLEQSIRRAARARISLARAADEVHSPAVRRLLEAEAAAEAEARRVAAAKGVELPEGETHPLAAITVAAHRMRQDARAQGHDVPEPILGVNSQGYGFENDPDLYRAMARWTHATTNLDTVLRQVDAGETYSARDLGRIVRQTGERMETDLHNAGLGDLVAEPPLVSPGAARGDPTRAGEELVGWTEEVLSNLTQPRDREAFQRVVQNNLQPLEVALANRALANTDFAGPPRFSKVTQKGGENYQEVVVTLRDIEGSGGRFESGHWPDVDNPLVHIRLQDRTIPQALGDGERVLYIQEMQSDWHQRGRQKGYSDQAAVRRISRELDEVHREMVEIQGQREQHVAERRRAILEKHGVDTPDELRALSQRVEPLEARQQARHDLKEFQELGDSRTAREHFPDEETYTRYLTARQRFEDLNRALREADRGLKDAPFKRTEEWAELGFRRALAEAVEKDYDRLVWATAEHAADANSLARLLSRIEWYPETGQLIGYNTHGQVAIQRAARSPEDLTELIGKEPARRLVDAGPPKVSRAPDLTALRHWTEPRLGQMSPAQIVATRYVERLMGQGRSFDEAFNSARRQYADNPEINHWVTRMERGAREIASEPRPDTRPEAQLHDLQRAREADGQYWQREQRAIIRQVEEWAREADAAGRDNPVEHAIERAQQRVWLDEGVADSPFQWSGTENFLERLGDRLEDLVAARVRGSHSIEGERLSIGYSHLEDFYNRTLPKVARTITKEYGGQIEPVHLPEFGPGGVAAENLMEVASGAPTNLSIRVTPEMKGRIQAEGQRLGAADPLLVGAMARVGAGAAVGAALDDEQPLRGAAIGAGVALLTPAGARRLRGMGESGSIPVRRAGEAADGSEPFRVPKDEYVAQRVAEAAPDDQGMTRMAAEQDWRRSMMAALSAGRITQEDAAPLGWKEFMAPAGKDGHKLTPLPRGQEYYHVTTGRSGVEDLGLRTRAELGGNVGLGGGREDAISLTTNRELAETIRDTLLLTRDVLSGKYRVQDLVRWATEGHGAEQPWVHRIMEQWVSPSWKPGDPVDPDSRFGRLQRGRAEEHAAWLRGDDRPPGGAFTREYLDERGWEPVGEGWVGGDGEPRWREASRPATEDEILEETFEFLRSWLWWREHQGKGPADPLFFSSDPKFLRDIDPRDVAIIRATPAEGAMGTQIRGMDEWRVYSGEAVETQTMMGRARLEGPAGPHLRASHNTTVEGLEMARRLGGIPHPSVAVHRADQPFDRFGEATLVGTRDLVDPAQGARVFDADAYTVRQPRIEADLTMRGRQFADELEKAAREVGESYSPESRRMTGGEAYRMLPERDMLDDPAAQLLYLRSQGVDFEPRYTGSTRPESAAFDSREVQEFLRTHGDRVARIDFKSPEHRRYSEAVRAGLERKVQDDPDLLARLLDAHLTDDGLVPYSHMTRLERDVRRARELGARGEVDRLSTRERLNDLVEQHGGKEALERWLRDQYEASFRDPVFAGTRKPYTLEEASERMARELRRRKGEDTMTFGPGNARAQAAEEVTSLEGFDAYRARLASADDVEAARKNIQGQLDTVTKALRAAFPEDSRGFGAQWDNLDNIHRAVAEVGRGRTPEAALQRQGFRTDHLLPEDLETFHRYAREILDAPQQYLEAKLRRPVPLRDFRAVIAPDDTPPSVLNGLQREGLQVETYPAGNASARRPRSSDSAPARRSTWRRRASCSAVGSARSPGSPSARPPTRRTGDAGR